MDTIGFTPATNSEKYVKIFTIRIQKTEKFYILIFYSYLLAQTLHEISGDIGDDKNYVLNLFDFDFTLYVLIVEIVFFSILLIFIVILNKTEEKKDSNSSFSYFIRTIFSLNDNFKKISLISIVLFGFIIFDFLIRQITLINIKTNKVIVDTSQVITNEERLFKSSLSAAWLLGKRSSPKFSLFCLIELINLILGERDIYLAQTAPNGTFLNNLYKFKNKNPAIIFDKVDFIKNINVMKDSFILMNSLVCNIVANFLKSLLKMNVFINQKPFFSTFNVLYRKKEKSFKIEILDKS